jgi:Transposase domain (DUF772)
MDAASWCRHLVPDGRCTLFLPTTATSCSRLSCSPISSGRAEATRRCPPRWSPRCWCSRPRRAPSDREAISALRRDIVWKVACGLRLDDEGFHPTVLVYWRNRIRTSPPATADLAGGPPGGGANRGAFGQHRRVLDSTVLEDAVATQDTVCQLIGAIRRSAGGWLRPARRDHDHPRGWRHSRVR